MLLSFLFLNFNLIRKSETKSIENKYESAEVKAVKTLLALHCS